MVKVIPERFVHTKLGGHRGRDGMLVGFTTTYATITYHH